MTHNKNTQTLKVLVGVAVFMLGMSFAAVPAYNLFCRVTGFGGTPSVADAGSDVILDRTVKIRFDASLEKGMPWQFKPVARTMTLRIGETGLAFFEAYNPTDKTVAGQASYNVYPYEAGGYFTKIDCFCFTLQVLKPHERVQMPVTFYVDPDMVNDPDSKYIKEITLSYTFHVTDLPEDEVALASEQAQSLN